VIAMTDSQWQTCADPSGMLLELLKRKGRWKWSTRKARLFSCACCRRVLPRPVYHRAVELAEKVADKEAKLRELQVFARLPPVPVRHTVPNPVQWAALAVPRGSPWWASNDARVLLSYSVPEKKRKQASEAECQAHCELIRDIVGFAPKLPAIDRAWRTSNVTALAQAIYDDRAFDRLPILADALEDAGCDNADILNHCRQPGEHCRGCWVVDLVLGKS
jgi:hypothetical protein